MAENKRFTYEYDEHSGNLFDNKMNTFYHIEDSDENIEILCDRLNWLVDGNKQLKSEYKVLHTQYQDLKKFVENNFDEYLTQEKLNRQIIKLSKENEQLKQVLGSILIEVRRDISATNHTGEVKAFVNPNSFGLISDVLKKYGALNDWYE